MSQFTKELYVKLISKKLWELTEGFEYHVGSYPSDEIIYVPTGFITDFASVPRLFWFILPPTGCYKAAALIHDYLYVTGRYSKLKSDFIFYEGMKVLNVEVWKRVVMFVAVFIFGWFSWWNHRLKAWWRCRRYYKK